MVEHICSLIHYISAVTEEDCLKGLGIAVGVTTACSKVGISLCPFTLGIFCIVSAICEGVKEGVVTDAKSACQACAQGKGSYEALSYLQDGQENILNLVQKANDGIDELHNKFDRIANQLDWLENMVAYTETMQNYRHIKRLFSYIQRDPKTGLVVSNMDLDNFLTLAMCLDVGLDRTLFQLFDMMNGVKGDPNLDNSMFVRVPESCGIENFYYYWGIISDCILMESIALSMSDRNGKADFKLKKIQDNLISISDQYVQDCGCGR